MKKRITRRFYAAATRLGILMFNILFITLVLVSPASAGDLPDTLEADISDAIDAQGVDDYAIDLNVRIPVTSRENPVGYDCDLWATVIRHTSVDPDTGSAKRPTILLATGYRREIMGTMRLLGFFLHGYNVVAIDLRGTGSGSGSWDPLGPIEQYDTAYMIDKWIPSQPWSDGIVGMSGGSYEGIIQYLAAGLVEQVYDPQKGEMVPKHLKAIAPISAYCDNYSDIVVPGGNIDAEFMAIWIILTDLMSVIPPDLFLNHYTKNGITVEEAELASQIWAEHTDHLMLPVQWVMDPSREYKTEWNELKSPMIYWPRKPAGGWTFSPGIPKAMGGNTICKNLPVFTATGWFDIFERGSLYNYQYGLANHSASDKAMIIGPWYHIDAAFTFPGITGLGLIGEENIFSWDVLVRWFDWKIKGKNDPFMVDYPVALYVLGEEKWRAEKSWPLPDSRLTDKTYYFSKTRPSLIPGDWFSLSNYSNNYTLVSTPSDSDYYYKFLWFKFPRSNPELQHDPTDLHGVTSRSAQRWFGFSPLTVLTQTFKYVLNINTDAITFWEDERDDEKGVLTFTTEPLTEDLEISGPLKLTFWASTEFNDPMTQAKIDETLATIKTRYTIEGDENNLVNYADKRDVQWVVEVNDVFANGRARNISSGCLSAAHRPYDPSSPTSVDPAYTAFDPFYNRGDKNPMPITENTLYQYVIEILPVTNVFKKGHRIRVSISGSDFPHLFPVFRPSINTLVLDDAHKAKIDFKAANKTGEGSCWKWIDNISDYLLRGI